MAEPLRNQRGTSTLEFIVILPALLLIFLASLELSRAWLTVNLVTSAVREGARVGVVTSPFNDAPAITRMGEILASANLLTGATRTVTCAAPCGPGSQVLATATVTFQTNIPLLQLVPDLAGPLMITQTASMRYESALVP